MLFLQKPTSKKTTFLLFLLLILMSLSGCGTSSTPNIDVSDYSLPDPQIKITAADQETACTDTEQIYLQEDEMLHRITAAGCYQLSGTMKGSLQLDAEEQIVHLILDNVTIDSPSGPALEILSAGKVILTLKEGTTNTFLDSSIYPVNTESDACIYSTCDLTINGSGALNVHGYFQDALHSKDVLKILGGNNFIQSKRDGLHGNDGIVVTDTTLTVQSERNGLNSTKTGKPSKGNVEIYDSECSLIGGNYAIHCIADLYIKDSSISAMGVYDILHVEGNSYIAEGSLSDE